MGFVPAPHQEWHVLAKEAWDCPIDSPPDAMHSQRQSRPQFSPPPHNPSSGSPSALFALPLGFASLSAIKEGREVVLVASVFLAVSSGVKGSGGRKGGGGGGGG